VSLDVTTDAAVLLAVIDGCGGIHDGDIATDLVSRRLVPELRRMSHKAPPEAMLSAFGAANAAVYDRGRADRRFRGAGATVTAALVVGDWVWFAQVGDTRGYVLHNGQLEHLTPQHTLIEELLASGQIEPTELGNYEPHRGVVTRAIGVTENVKPDIVNYRLHAGSTLLLSTDGLWRMVDHAAIAETLFDHPPATACQRLITAANEAGGHDNVSVVVAAVE